jgi:AhpD family alkylhydroperoxidase
MGTVGLELLGDKFFLVHRSHSLFAVRHGDDERNLRGVTAERRGSVKGSKPGRMEIDMLQARMKHPVMVVPEAMKNLQALGDLTKQGLPEKLVELVHLRASQINGCSACVDMHPKLAKRAGETDERLFAVAAWHDAPYFTDGERAALALTESLTRLADRTDAVPDEIWEEAVKHFDETGLASLILAIASINVWNRLNAAVRQPVGAWKV